MGPMDGVENIIWKIPKPDVTPCHTVASLSNENRHADQKEMKLYGGREKRSLKVTMTVNSCGEPSGRLQVKIRVISGTLRSNFFILVTGYIALQKSPWMYQTV